MPDAREKRFIAEGDRAPRRVPTGAVPMLGGLIDQLQSTGGTFQRMAQVGFAEDIDAENARLTADVYNTVNRLATEHDNPETFRAAAAGYGQAMLSRAHPLNAQRLQPYLDRNVSDAYLRLVKVAEARNDEANLAEFLTGIDARLDEAGWIAQNGGDLTENRAGIMEMIDAATGRKDADGNPGIDPGSGKPLRAYLDDIKASQILQQYDEQVATRGWIGQFERADDKAAFLEKFRKSQPKGLTVEKHDALSNRFEADVRADQAAARAVAAEQRAELAFQRQIVGDEVENVVSLLDSGYRVPDAEANRVAQEAASRGFVDMEAEVYRAKRENVALRELAAMPLDEFGAALQQQPSTVADAKFLERAGRVYRDQVQAREDDPLIAAQNVGIVDLAPVDPTKPESWQARVETAERVRSRWGMDQVSPLTSSEADAFKVALEDADVSGKLQLLTAAKEGVGEERFQGIVQQLAKKGAGPMIVAADVLSTQGPGRQSVSTARDILLGATLEPTHRKVIFPNESAVDGDLVTEIGDAYEVDPAAQRMVMDAAKLHYLAHAARAGTGPYVAGDTASVKKLRESLDAVSGGIVSWNDNQILAPRGWDEARFREWMDSIDAQYLEEHGGISRFEDEGGAARAADLISRTGRLVPVDSTGSGKYLVEVDDSELGRAYLHNSAGDPFVLDAMAGVGHGKRPYRGPGAWFAP